MTETYDPILDDTPLSRAKRWFGGPVAIEPHLLAPIRSTAVVLRRRTDGDGATAGLVLAGGDGGPRGADVETYDRVVRVDLGEKGLVWDIAVDGRGAAGSSVARIMTTVAVTDPLAVVTLGVRDVRGRVRAQLAALVDACAAGTTDPNVLADAVVQRLSGFEFDCGVGVRWAYVLVEPDAAARERRRATQAMELEHELAAMQMRFDEERARHELERERSMLEDRREHAKQQEELAAERQRAKQGLERERRRLQEEVEAEIQELVARRERAELEEAARRRDAEVAHAKRVNADIADHPANVIGYLLALGDREPAREALAVVQDRQRQAWERFKELQKLDVLDPDQARALAVAIMSDPAGGAFGLSAEAARHLVDVGGRAAAEQPASV